jgi:threonine aldolase
MSEARFDLRSDTVTAPSAEMRAMMARADVGDDVYREDPTTRKLEERVAALLGKEAALFVPSGTMGNQIALLLHTQRGAEVVVAEGAHVVHFEAGAGAAWSGVQFVVAGKAGLFTAHDVESVARAPSDMVPETRLVWIENTHNRSGGRVFPQAEIAAIAEMAHRLGVALHLDGARLWNAAAATGVPEAELAAPFETVGVCFSKGLGAPVGSAIAGSTALMERARRFRKMLGGAMRQSGVLAAAALYALEHHRERLVVDHQAARRLAEILESSPHVTSRAASVETNIVVVDLRRPCARDVVRAAEELGVLAHAISPAAIRLVTHLDFPAGAVEKAASILLRSIERAATSAA